MKHKFLVLIGLVASLVIGQAATSVTTINATNNAVLTSPYVLESITIVPTTNGIVYLYDHANKGLTNVTASSIVTRSYTTNIVSEYVGPTGMTNTWTNTVIWYYPYTNAAATNSVTAFAALPVVTGEAYVQTFNQPLAKGLVVSNSGAGQVIVQYRTP